MNGITIDPKYYVAPRRRKKREPDVLKEFSLKFRGLDMYIYVLDNDEWLIECEKGVKDISIFGDVRAYAEAEGFVDDLLDYPKD